MKKKYEVHFGNGKVLTVKAAFEPQNHQQYWTVYSTKDKVYNINLYHVDYILEK